MFKNLDKSSLNILQLQLLLLIMLGLAIIDFAGIAGLPLFFLQPVFSFIYLFLLFRLKKHFPESFLQYIIFFLVLLAAVQAAVFFNFLALESFLRYSFILALLVFLLVFFISFKLIFGKNYVIGVVVISDPEKAVVKTKFDLSSFVNAGEYIVKSNAVYEKGSRVKVRVKRTLFARKPYKIISEIKV